MRVGLIVSGGVDRSGMEVIPALLWLIERLARRHDVQVFALHHQHTAQDYPLLGAHVHDLGTRGVPKGWRRLAQRSRLRRLLRTLPPCDVLHAWWGVPAGWVATAIPARVRPPVVVTATSGEFVGDDRIAYGLQRRWIDRRLVRNTMRRAAIVTVATHHMAALAARYGVRTTVVPHGVPREHFAGLARAGGPWRLIHVGDIKPVKDQTTLLQAVALLRQRAPSQLTFHLDIVGVDTQAGTAQQLVHSLGLDEHVTFHGARPHAEVRALLQQAHVHVMASRHEAGGVSILDAAAAGIPTVGTHVGYIADWSPDAAVAVRVGDPAALAEALAGILVDPDRRTALAAAAQARAAAHTADDMAAAFERVYHAVVPDSRTPGSGIA